MAAVATQISGEFHHGLLERQARAAKTCEFHSYESAGHGFFGVGRSDYRETAALDGWGRVFEWCEKSSAEGPRR